MPTRLPSPGPQASRLLSHSQPYTFSQPSPSPNPILSPSPSPNPRNADRPGGRRLQLPSLP